MLFHKKAENRAITPDDISAMTKRGMSDKDIIKALKARGYSYNDIERAMLTAVKSNVSQDTTPRQQQQSSQSQDFVYDFGEESPADDTSMMSSDDIFGSQPQPQFQDLPQLSPEPQQPVEELVEGIIEEKWQKFQDEMLRFEESLERISGDMKIFEERIDATKQESPTAELEARLTELTDHLDELDARVGGLERAFKQMLPNLTRNIESLSALVNEMKSKQEPKSFA